MWCANYHEASAVFIHFSMKPVIHQMEMGASGSTRTDHQRDGDDVHIKAIIGFIAVSRLHPAISNKHVLTGDSMFATSDFSG